jgi:hypothetical protein
VIRIVSDEGGGEVWWCEEQEQRGPQGGELRLVRCAGRRREVEVQLPESWLQLPDEALTRLIQRALADGAQACTRASAPASTPAARPCGTPMIT